MTSPSSDSITGTAGKRRPSLDAASPNPQGEGRLIRDQTRRRARSVGPHEASASTRRRRLVAIARDRLREVAGTGLDKLWRKIEAGWAGCGWSALYRNEDSGNRVGLPDHCDKPPCPYCDMRRAWKVRDRYRARHDQALRADRLWFVVLTVPNVRPGELRAELDRIRAAIGRMRRRSWWITDVKGGIWRLEVTINLRTRTWHPHANLLFETHAPIQMSAWQPRLQAEWRSVLGETAAQWVWLMPGWSDTLAEAVKRQLQVAAGDHPGDETHLGSTIDYAIKPDPHWIDPSDPDWVIEYVEALAKRRAISSFGDWRGLTPQRRGRPPDLVVAPYASGDNPFRNRYLPERDPMTASVARWAFDGHGPRWALRPCRPVTGGPRRWLMWMPGDGPDPGTADDDLAISYQANLAFGRV